MGGLKAGAERPELRGLGGVAAAAAGGEERLDRAEVPMESDPIGTDPIGTDPIGANPKLSLGILGPCSWSGAACWGPGAGAAGPWDHRIPNGFLQLGSWGR